MLGQPFRFGKSAAQQELDLGVRAAQLIGGPPGQRVVNGRIQPQQHALALAHHVTVPASLVEGASVDDLLGGLLATQDNEQIGHHRGLALLIQLDDVLVLEPL